MDVNRQIHRDFSASWLLQPARVVRDAVDRDAMVVREDSADPDGGAHLVLGNSNPLSRKVFRAVDLAVDIHIDARVSKHARGEDRNRDEGSRIREVASRVPREGHLGGFEVPVVEHSEETLRHLHGEEVQIDAFNLDAPVLKSAHTVVVPAGERDRLFAHGLSFAEVWETGSAVVERASSSARGRGCPGRVSTIRPWCRTCPRSATSRASRSRCSTMRTPSSP